MLPELIMSNGTDKSPDEPESPKYLLKNSTIISAFRINVDACDRLWVLDSGLADILDNPRQITPNTLLIFDLKSDQLLRRYELPADNVKEDSFIANIVSWILNQLITFNYSRVTELFYAFQLTFSPLVSINILFISI